MYPFILIPNYLFVKGENLGEGTFGFSPFSAPITFPHSGPRQSPAKRVCWGEEEQGSGGRATKGSPNRSGLCDDEKVPPKEAEEGERRKREKEGRGGVRQKRDKTGTNLRQKWDKSGTKTG